MAIALMKAGKRIGVTSLSHKAIHNLLCAIQHEADKQGFPFKGVKRAGDNPETRYESECIDPSNVTDACADPAYDLVAGTGWALSREARRLHAAERARRRALRRRSRAALARRRPRGRHQRALADPARRPEPAAAGLPGLASGRLRRLRPPAPARGAQDGAGRTAGCSSPRRGGCDPSSARSPRRPTTRAGSGTRAPAARRSLDAGNGPAWIPVEHEHHAQSSREEVDAVAAAVDELVGTPYTDEEGAARPLCREDILVVAPYNAQVRMLRARLPEAVAVGTVDKFQGQQAPVVIVSMASSSAEDAPRGLGFAFDPQPLQRRDVTRAMPRRARLRARLARRSLQDDPADAARQRRVLVRRSRRRVSGSSDAS